jgi:hypothetical protein
MLESGRIREGEESRRLGENDEKGCGWSAKEEYHQVAQASLSRDNAP